MTDLTEPVDDPRPSEPVPESSKPVEPADPAHELAHSNTVLGWALLGLFLLLFAGTWLVGFIYLALA